MKFACSHCGREIELTSPKDVYIEQSFTGRLKISFTCPNCSKEVLVPKTPEAEELLNERIRNREFDQVKDFDPINDAFIEEFQ